jgi:hypothetical protein
MCGRDRVLIRNRLYSCTEKGEDLGRKSKDQQEMWKSVQNLLYIIPTKLQFIVPPKFQGRRFFKFQPIRNKNCSWRP